MEDKKNIGALFDRIAKTYDKLNHMLSFNTDQRWRRHTINEMHPCDSVLDVAVGTADLAIEILRQGKASHVVGIDLSKEMLRLGQQKIEARGMQAQITLQQCSALQIPYTNNSFSAVTCAYGIRNFSDLDQGLREMQRVLKPNGQLLILEFSYPENPIIRGIYNLYFNHFLPLIGRWVSKEKNAYRYLNQSVKEFVYGQELAKRLTVAGFKDINFKPLSFGISTIYIASK